MEPVLLDHNSKKIRKKETGQRTNCKILSLESKKRKGGKECLPHSVLGETRGAEIAQPVERVLIGSLQCSASSPGSFSVSRATAASANRS